MTAIVRNAASLLWLVGVVAVIVAAVARTDRESDARLRNAVLKASLLLGALAVAVIETLSAFTLLSAVPLVTCSAGIVTVAIAIISASPRPHPLQLVTWRHEAVRTYAAAGRHRVLALLVLSCVLLTLLIAVAAPPNNWDAMTYHMPRIAHWLANGSVRHYPVARTQQLFMPPLNAYLMAIIQAVAGSDMWANLVQWASYVAGAAVASLVVRRLDGGPTAELAAAFAFATLPMAIAQASTTQADLLTAYWVLVLIALAVGPHDRFTSVWAGLAVGLGMLTKPSFALYAAPLVVALLVRNLRGGTLRRRLTSSAVGAAVLGSVAIAIQTPHALRNAATFGTPLGGGHEVARMQNEDPGPRSWLSNLMRATAIHVPIPGYGTALIEIHRMLGIDPDDPRTTHLHDLSFSEVAAQWFRPLIPSENSVGNPAHFLTAIVLLLAILVRPRGLSPNVATAIAIALIGALGWMLLSLPFKWQAWASRFDLPLFAALSVALGFAMSRASPRAATLVMASWLSSALPTLSLAVHRPLLDVALVTRIPGAHSALAAIGDERIRRALDARGAKAPSILRTSNEDLLFRSNPDVYALYRSAVARVQSSGCSTIGLELDRDDWEYPFWRLLGAEAGSGNVRIEIVGVTNETAKLPAEGPPPCIVVSAVEPSAFRDEQGWTAAKLSDGRLFTIYRRNESGRDVK